MALPILCLTLAACGKPNAAAKAADPNTPAVVKLPPPVLPGDTAKKPVPPVVSDDEARTTLSRNYALFGAGFAFGNPRLVAESYSPTAELTTPNGTFVGQAAIVKALAKLGMDGSIKDFQRVSRVMKIVDSSVTDSGTFTIVRQRAGADSSVERGTYASVWRIHPPPMVWVMMSDHLHPAPGKKRK
jgi:hypothetical protein